MTVAIQKANINTSQVVQGLSRYKNSTVIYWGDQNLICFETYLRQGYTITGNEKVMLVTPGLAYRPDLMSYEVYGLPDAWWEIMEVNGIYDIYDFKAGITVIIPSTLM